MCGSRDWLFSVTHPYTHLRHPMHRERSSPYPYRTPSRGGVAFTFSGFLYWALYSFSSLLKIFSISGLVSSRKFFWKNDSQMAAEASFPGMASAPSPAASPFNAFLRESRKMCFPRVSLSDIALSPCGFGIKVDSYRIVPGRAGGGIGWVSFERGVGGLWARGDAE